MKNGHVYIVHVGYITCVFILTYFVESAIRNVEEGTSTKLFTGKGNANTERVL